MSQTPLLQIPELYQGQAAFAFHNQAIRDLEIFASGGAIAILDTPPTTPIESSIYIVAAINATGAFTGNENQIAQYRNNNWVFFAPFPGCNIYCQDIQNFRYWDESQTEWKELSVAPQGALLAANNLSDLADSATAIANLGAIPVTQKGAISGVATLDSSGKIPNNQLSAIALSEVYVVADIPARDALTVQTGDVAKVTSESKDYIFDGTNWIEFYSATVDTSNFLNRNNNLSDLTNVSIALSNLGGIPTSSIGVADGVASLGSDGIVPANQLPSASGGSDYIITEAIATLPYTLVQADHKKNKVATGTGTINIPDNFPDGWYCNLILDGTGDLTISASGVSTIKFSGGTTNNHLKKENAVVTIIHEAGNSWRIFGANEP